MPAVDSQAVWSILDQKGTQTMMKSVLGAAAGLADYDTVKNRMKDASYTMDFSNGVRFNMTVDMSDTITAATAATIMKGVRAHEEVFGIPSGEVSDGRYDDRFQRGRADRGLFILGQPVRRPAYLAVVPAGGGQVALDYLK